MILPITFVNLLVRKGEGGDYVCVCVCVSHNLCFLVYGRITRISGNLQFIKLIN